MKRFLVAGILGGALLLGGVSQASAAVQAPQVALATTLKPGGPNARPAQRPGGGMILASLLKATADVTGLKAADIARELKAGKTLAQIAEANGNTAADVIQSARNAAKTRLDTAVKNGTLTQAQEDKALAEFDSAAPQLMQQPNPVHTVRKQQAETQRARRIRALLVKATADVSGMTVKDVAAQVKAGKSLSQIAQEHGKTTDDILARLRELADDKIDDLLEQARALIEQPAPVTP